MIKNNPNSNLLQSTDVVSWNKNNKLAIDNIYKNSFVFHTKEEKKICLPVIKLWCTDTSVAMRLDDITQSLGSSRKLKWLGY